jgi:hypothetical protein
MSNSQLPQGTIDFYEKMNQMNQMNQMNRENNSRREDRRARGLGMRLNAPGLDEAAPWAIKSAGKRKSRRHKRTRKSRKHKKSRKSKKNNHLK